MFQYTLLSYITALCAVIVVGQVNQDGKRIQMTDGRVTSSVLRRWSNGGCGDLCTFPDGVTTCPVKSGELARFNCTIKVNGGVNSQAITRLLVTMQLGDSNIVTQALICQVTGGTLVIGSAGTTCPVFILADGRYRVAPYGFRVPAVTVPKVMDLKIWADLVDWSDGTTNKNWLLGMISVKVFP